MKRMKRTRMKKMMMKTKRPWKRMRMRREEEKADAVCELARFALHGHTEKHEQNTS
jgi:hypothetical protein